MREPNYDKKNSLFHGKSEKVIAITMLKANVVREEMCVNLPPKSVGG
jgi:hypothetical protein